MFVVYTEFSSKVELSNWADPAKFPELFNGVTVVGNTWNRSILIDGDLKPRGVRLTVNESICFIFYAKDRKTLKDGLKNTLPSSNITTKEGQLGLFGGSYDFEEFGAWAANKSTASRNWKDLKERGKTEEFKAEGLHKSDYVTFWNRQRLLKRGYFMIVAQSVKLQRIKHARTFIGSEHMIRSLAHFLP
jgi:hypothetical protein